ncbi:MAG: GNAT family N-acetyltransferase [Telmatospirillum sp.]|nr:GNAT family N-acetyltransferase [Telmatospirillum sp.]
MLRLRPLKLDDLELVCRHREEMFREAGRSRDTLNAMREPFRRWLELRLARAEYFGFVAELAGEPIGGIGLMAIEWPPHPAHPLDARRGYVLNVFVEPEHRGRGVARALMAASDEEFARQKLGYAILHATDAGKPLYERIGWAATTEMGKPIRPD